MKYIKVLSESISDQKDVKVKMNAAAAVIMKYDEAGNKRILLIQRAQDDHWPNHYEFPRGKCDNGKNENTIVCVKREVKEETGLDIKVLALIDKFQYLADGGERLTTCYNYLCKLKNPNQKIKLSNEHQDYKFIGEIGEAEMLVLPDQKRTIEKVLNGDRPLTTYPEIDTAKNNQIEEYVMLDKYLEMIQEMKDINGKRVPSPSSILAKYQDEVTAQYKKMIKKCRSIKFTSKQKLMYELCVKKVLLKMNHTPPKCPQYKDPQKTKECVGAIKGQYSSYKRDQIYIKRRIVELEKILRNK